MKSEAMSQVDKSTVNRDYSVREPSFNLKPDLASQILFVCNASQYVTRPTTQRINILHFSCRKGYMFQRSKQR